MDAVEYDEICVDTQAGTVKVNAPGIWIPEVAILMDRIVF